MLFFTTGETSRALLAQQQVRRFSNLSRIHTTGCFYINYCPRSSFLFWILQKCLLSFIKSKLRCISPPKRTIQFSLWRQRRSRLSPIKFQKLADWSWTAAFLLLLDVLDFVLVASPNHSQNVKNWTEQ